MQSLIAGLIAPGPSQLTPAPPVLAKSVEPISANAARDIALAVHPKSNIVQVAFPSGFFPFYSIRLYPTDQPKTRFTRQVVIDPSTGKIVMTFDPSTQIFARRFFNLWMIWIHNGQFFGLVGRLVLVFTGLVLTMLFPTGLYLWLRKRRARGPRVQKPAAARS